jgi:hypothetical protein
LMQLPLSTRKWLRSLDEFRDRPLDQQRQYGSQQQ